MNNSDCLANIYDFLETSQVVKLSKDTASERFPKKLTLTSVDQINQFNRWCEKFDTSRLEEVLFNISTREFAAARGFPIGAVPPSVKHLTIQDDNFSMLAVPPTVEVLVIKSSQQRHIDLPNGIRKLVLGGCFNGSIRTFPSTLEELTILGWDQPWGLDTAFPRRLQHIPETVHTIEIGESAPVVVWRWPVGVQKVVLPKLHWAVAVWLDHDHAPIPEEVEVEIRSNTHLQLERQCEDPWDEPEQLSPTVIDPADMLEWEPDY